MVMKYQRPLAHVLRRFIGIPQLSKACLKSWCAYRQLLWIRNRYNGCTRSLYAPAWSATVPRKKEGADCPPPNSLASGAYQQKSAEITASRECRIRQVRDEKSAQRLPLRHHLEIVAVRGNRPLRTIVSGFIARKNISIGPL
jgi:hypothetical protein